MEKQNQKNWIPIVTISLLAIVTSLSLYCSWQSNLYSGKQSSNYTQCTEVTSEGTAMSCIAKVDLISDMEAYDKYVDLRLELQSAIDNSQTSEITLLQNKIDIIKKNISSATLEPYLDALDQDINSDSPFNDENFCMSYYETAFEKLEKGNTLREEGENFNNLSDKLQLSVLAFSISLFILGIEANFDSKKIQIAFLVLSMPLNIFGLIYMFQTPFTL